MATFIQAKETAKRITPTKASSDLFRFIKTIEKEIFDLNTEQLEQAEDANDGVLINKDSRFSGVYAQLTEDIASVENPVAPKIAGELYNFAWDGDFLSNFQMEVFPDHVEIFSTGDGGADEKGQFFDGYESLYGLNSKSIVVIIEKRIQPYMLEYYRKQLQIL